MKGSPYQIGFCRTDLNVTMYTDLTYLGSMEWRFSKDHLEEQWKDYVDHIDHSSNIECTSWWLGTKENYDQKYVKVLIGTLDGGVFEMDSFLGGDHYGDYDRPQWDINCASLESKKLDELGVIDINIMIDVSDSKNFDGYVQFDQMQGWFDAIDSSLVHTLKIEFKLKPILFKIIRFGTPLIEISEMSHSKMGRETKDSNKNEVWLNCFKSHKDDLKDQLWVIEHSQNTYNIEQLNNYSVKFNEYIPSMLRMTGLKLNYEIDERVEGIYPNALVVHKKRVRVRNALTVVLLGFGYLCRGQKDMCRLISQYIWETRFDECWLESNFDQISQNNKKNRTPKQ
jgi:hypothetical protein